MYNKSYASLLYILIALINKCINNASYVNVVGINSFNIFTLSLYNPVPNLLLYISNNIYINIYLIILYYYSISYNY